MAKRITLTSPNGARETTRPPSILLLYLEKCLRAIRITLRALRIYKCPQLGRKACVRGAVNDDDVVVYIQFNFNGAVSAIAFYLFAEFGFF